MKVESPAIRGMYGSEYFPLAMKTVSNWSLSTSDAPLSVEPEKAIQFRRPGGPSRPNPRVSFGGVAAGGSEGSVCRSDRTRVLNRIYGRRGLENSSR